MSQPKLAVSLVLASSLTRIHPGAGRAPGVVDLPVVRDPLGYPFIPGTMIKGTLRSLLIRKSSSSILSKEIKCLFGPDVEAESKYAGALTFHDLYPLLIPAPSSELGVVYVTTPSLLGRAAAIAEAAGKSDLANLFISLARSASRSTVLIGASSDGETRVGAFRIKYNRFYNISGLDKLINMAKDLHKLYEAVPFKNRIIIITENIGSKIINSLLVRVTRVRLNRATKTVQSGGLWTEEYIPWGTLFTGIIVDNSFRGTDCNNLEDSIKKLLELLKIDENRFVDIVVGGKETVGGGLLRLKLILGDMS